MLKGFFSSINRITKTTHSHNVTAESAHPSALESRLSEAEVTFLSMLEGRRSADTSVMGWWCAQHNIDGSRVINKLHTNGYLKLADYKFNLEKARVPALKEFLREHNLPTKGKKGELVNRIVENIDKDKCLAHFKESYWAFTSKATERLQEERAKAQAEYRADIDLIRRGQLETFKRKMYPNTNEHWGTEDTFYETIQFVMLHGFEDFNLSEEVRRNISSFVAARAVNYNSRGHAGCIAHITDYLE